MRFVRSEESQKKKAFKLPCDLLVIIVISPQCVCVCVNVRMQTKIIHVLGDGKIIKSPNEIANPFGYFHLK